MFLEQWTCAKMGQRLKNESEYLNLWRSGGFTRATLEEYQFLKLKQTLDYVYQKSSFYQGLFDRAGIKPGNIQRLEELDKFPFVTSSDLAESPYRFLCVSLGDVGRIYTLNTGGTTGAPKRVFLGEIDLAEISDYMGAAIKTVAKLSGAGDSGYKVAILLPDGERASQANLLAMGIDNHGGIPIKMDISLDNQGQFACINELKPDIVFGSVFRLWRLTQQFKWSHDLTRIGVKVLFITSEYMSEAMREGFRSAWACDVYCHYGMTEMGFGGGIECDSHTGFHFNEADFLFEVIDPETGLSVSPGEEGELVLTTLHREAMPLIRYRTGDLSRLIVGPCECGASTLQRIGRVAKRIGAIVQLGTGDEVYPSMFDDALFTIPEVIDYQPVLVRYGSKENLSFKIEVTRGGTKVERGIIRKLLSISVINRNIEYGAMTEPRVELVEQGTLKRRGRTKKLIADER